MFFATARIRQMTDEIAVQLVNIDAPEIVNLLALKVEHLATRDHGDMDAFAIQYIAVHDRPPVQGWTSVKGCARWPAIARQIVRWLRGPLSPSTLSLRYAGFIGALQSSYLRAKSRDLTNCVVMVLPRWKLASGR
jgi:hypothetical protein